MRTTRSLCMGAAALLFWLAGCAQFAAAERGDDTPLPAAPPRSLDVPYVPTPQPVVEEMLRLAGVGEHDLVYDLGSGDGRIVIAAARDHGARGLGIDLDPERVAEARANAREAGVDDRVEFLQGDLFELDLSEATVVTMYLLSAVNLRLRPKLLAELQPGTPVVSHAFAMAEWDPDETVQVDSRTVYLWYIPGEVQGSWELEVRGAEGERTLVLELEQEFQIVHGSARIDGRRVPLQQGRLRGEELSFVVRYPDDAQHYRFAGRVSGDRMEGTLRAPEAGADAEPSGTWRARRTGAAPAEARAAVR
jgi:SAM-dependent methyltransferase